MRFALELNSDKIYRRQNLCIEKLAADCRAFRAATGRVYMISDSVAGILERHENGQGQLIAILQEIQSVYSYLPREALEEVARKTGRSLTDIYGVATFYSAFSLEPRGKHLVSVCLGTACHVRGGPAVAEEIERQLGIRAGQTTTDREFS
ncbi:hypothetical protein GF420_02585, partial [candidate division GN15 bacterium]|nr:hypothetical protein [candidate division GN15 bacterium]